MYVWLDDLLSVYLLCNLGAVRPIIYSRKASSILYIILTKLKDVVIFVQSNTKTVIKTWHICFICLIVKNCLISKLWIYWTKYCWPFIDTVYILRTCWSCISNLVIYIQNYYNLLHIYLFSCGSYCYIAGVVICGNFHSECVIHVIRLSQVSQFVAISTQMANFHDFTILYFYHQL